ncbi:MAG: bi-domain-containing oxidoreductase [Candidatus Competibacter sp.]|nr:bi-domain-containing oxidoreductase [Candidatus Competibacter sp.]
MKQILQNLATGATELAEVPCPALRTGHLLIQTRRSLISAGTERMLVEFGKAGWIDKARQQPDKVRMVLDKIRTDGLAATLDTVRAKLDQPLPLGYCNAGVVLEVGAGADGYAPGDRVVSNGRHAEAVCVPKNLCAKIPDPVGDDAAAFTVLGAIALQGIRLLAPTLGETIAVTGLGLIGLLAVQLLRAAGCRVLGLDLDPARLALARRFGADTVDLGQGQDPLAVARARTGGRGLDGVLIAASTSSNEPVGQAARMCRPRGRIVLVGVTGLTLSRADFYEKELSFQVSCSYGPGRYDPTYEEQGHDYPVGHVRWTEQRNFEAVLDLLADGRLEVGPLISHRFPLEQAPAAYQTLADDRSALGIVLDYGGVEPGRVRERTVELPQPLSQRGRGGDRLPSHLRRRVGEEGLSRPPAVGFIGAGNYAGRVLIPAFVKAGARPRAVVTGSGVGGVHYGRKYRFQQASTDPATVLADPTIDAVVIATRHDSHARYVIQALRAGKHVFVEKPLCLTLEELAEIEAALAPSPSTPLPPGEGGTLASSPLAGAARGERDAPSLLTPHSSPLLMVGFNRRFAPQIVRIKALLATVGEPGSFVVTVNAGAIPAGHWTQDPAIGGGRIVGEACHFIDLLRHLAGAAIVDHQVLALGGPAGRPGDVVSLGLRFADGSIGAIHYFANGHKAFPKERLEVFSAGRVLQLDNFRTLGGYGWPGFKAMKLWRQDKGQDACAAAFIQAVRAGGPAPIAPEEIIEVGRVAIEVAGECAGQGH